MPASYTMPTHLKGDTFNGVTFTITINGSPLDLTSAIISMDVRVGAISKLRLDNDSNGGITILDAVNGIFRIDEQIIDIPERVYDYDIQFALSSGAVKTYIDGTWEITKELTHD